MKITPRVPIDIPPMDIWYKYNSQKVLGFIATEGGGGAEPSDPYLSRFPNNYYNIYIISVVFHTVLVRYFNGL